MPVQPTYPGIYIEELPAAERTITAAPTSITVFIGYSHPFKTPKVGEAVRIQSFAEYERAFGGMFTLKKIECDLPTAVRQFFQNGGADAYVVGIKPRYFDNGTPKDITGATATVGGVTFEAREPTSEDLKMKVTVGNVRQTTTANDTADITVVYGTRAETFRGVTASGIKIFFDDRSSLVKVNDPVPESFSSASDVALTSQVIDPGWQGFLSTDFTEVFAEEGSLDKVEIFNLLVIPGVDDTEVASRAVAFCERKRAFYIMDPPRGASADSIVYPAIQDSLPRSPNAAVYFPYLRAAHPITQQEHDLPPSGVVAGIFARTDNNRGVWKAPAGLEAILRGVRGVRADGRMTDQRAGMLNEKAVNAIRTFSGVGTVVFGARTLAATNSAFQQWKYVPVRRMALWIEQTLQRNLGWVIFEPNDEPLWVTIRTSIEAFMLSLFQQGAFQGTTPSQAFLVKCDATTTTQQDINNGVVNILVGFCPLKPAEFVIVKIAQLAGQAQA